MSLRADQVAGAFQQPLAVGPVEGIRTIGDESVEAEHEYFGAAVRKYTIIYSLASRQHLIRPLEKLWTACQVVNGVIDAAGVAAHKGL